MKVGPIKSSRIPTTAPLDDDGTDFSMLLEK